MIREKTTNPHAEGQDCLKPVICRPLGARLMRAVDSFVR